MKISEMTNDQAAVALLRMSGPFANISDDADLMVMFDEIRAMKGKGVSVASATVKMIPKFVAFGMAKHKNDLYEIVGALLQKPAGAVGKMNLLETIKAVQDSFDEDTISFFTQLGDAAKSKGEQS